jgi:cytochrome P450
VENPFRLFQDPLGYLSQIAVEKGDVARMGFGGREFVLLNDPERIEELLLWNAAGLEKFPRIERTKGLFGEGLLTSEEPLHLRQRRLAQPAFHRERLAGYATEMVAATKRMTAGWRDGEQRNAAFDMGQLALDIVSRTLFTTQTSSQALTIARALDCVVETLNHLVTPWGSLLLGLPTQTRRRYREALGELDRVIYGLIAERRAQAEPGDDLMGMLMRALDEETGKGMDDLQLRDELMTIFVAGHDTTANALAWTLYLLSQHPEHRARVEEEVDRVLGGREAGMGDVGQLVVTTKVFREALRMYPPVWILGRRLLRDVELSGVKLKRGTVVLVSMAVLHRRPKLYPEPDRFDPDRGEPEHRFAYLPFGAGTRLCIGERFAWMEGVLCLATMAQRWRLDVVEGAVVEPHPLLTLRPRNGLPVVVRERGGVRS